MTFLSRYTFLVGLVALLTGYSSVSFAQHHQDSDFRFPPANGWDSSRYSLAVRSNVNAAIHNFQLKMQAGQLTASDVEAVAVSMKTNYDHLQEIGFNAAMEKKLLGNEEAFLNFHPSDSDLQSIQERLASDGIQSNVSGLRSALDIDNESRLRFLALVKKQGLYKTELRLVEQFRNDQLQLVSQSNTHSGLRLTHGKPREGRVIRVISTACQTCFVAAGVGIASGCTVTGPACGAALVACGVCAIWG